ncbi:tudor domain-containing 6 isoform X2 [Pygocentrus nattereri]|uniref:Tudor domain-containing protein n=1 Tax=Pygocentrus nattereri TaxID=42514 RepID=A0A3B4DJ12_PYGNA|nr:tudor domain-containing 6 isoform X2 [Pygocentrus nattereri]
MCSIPGLPSPGSSVSVLIARVNLNPLCVLVEFWCNFDQDRRLAYQRMKKEIQYPRQVFHEAEGSPGDLCLVRVYETWYRARIVSRNPADYSVFLIDEGRTLRATTDTLAWGQTDFFYLPPEVEFCVLANVLPLSPENRWSKMALEFMKTFSGRKVTACVQDVVVPQRTFLLDIPCLSKQMFEMGFAKKLSNERFRDFVTRSLQSHMESVDPQITVKNEPMELPDQTEKQHCYMYPELETEMVETVIVTEVTDPLRVFCQLKVFSQELRKLTEHITQHYEGRVGAFFARPENLGAPCASRGSDGKWYRSILQQVMSSNSVAEVLHVDYGKKQFVQVEDIRPLASEFFRMPVVTYICSLHGIIDRGLGWSASQIDFLKSLLLNRTVIAKFEYQSLSEGVHYVTLYGDEKTSVNSLFGLREKCLIDSKSHTDYAVRKSTSSQKSKMSVGNEPKGTNLTGLDLKGNAPVFFTESLSPNTSHVAVVKHVDSPAKFWIQTQKYAGEFDQLMEGLEKLYSDLASPEGLIRKPVPGQFCVAKCQDGVFYRAAVCRVSDERADIFFLDYGNTELVDCYNLRELPPRFQKLPALAVKCALYGIQPNGESWDQKSTLFFSKAVLDKVLDVHVLAKCNYTHVVKLIDSESDGEKDLSKLLCSVGFAESVGLKKVVDKPVVKGYPQKGQTCNITEKYISPAVSSPAVTETRAAFKEYLFPIGSSVEVTVSYIESPNDFWCQKANNAECLKLLMQDLQEYYANSQFQTPLESACVANHPENGMWYRALVIQRHQTPHVTVLFVDYGQTKKVAIHDLRRINPAFLKLKGQAFRCSLYNLIHPVSHYPSDWGPDATSQFKDFVDNAASMNVVLKCTVYAVMHDVQKVAFNVVDLETPFQSVSNLFLQRGLADHAPSTKGPLLPFLLNSYYYSTHGVKTGSEEDVNITSVKNVNHFFCQLERNSAQLEELAEKVNKLCSQLESIDCPETFGKVCFAKYTDGLWYRGQITSTKPSIVVNFVDYGDKQEVDISDILPVPFEAGEIMAVPVQAIEGGLSDMPEKVPNEVNNWFENFVTDRALKALVVAKEPNGKLIVELYNGRTRVNAMIREKFRIEREKNEQVTVKGFNFKDRNAQNVSHRVNEGYSCDEAGSVIKAHENVHGFKRGKEPQQTPNDWKCLKDNVSKPVDRTVKSQGGDTRRDVTQMELRHLDSYRESQTESVEVNGTKPCGLKEAELPLKEIKQGMEEEVFISHYDSPLSFFVQLLNDEDDICSLGEKLNDDQSQYVPINPSDICEGDLVSAVFPDDSCWYRAVVRKMSISDAVDVEFIDFGNCAKVSVSQLCSLDRLLSSHPRYSIPCSLTGMNNADSEVASILKKEIEANAGKVTCTFIKLLGSVWEVKLEVSGKLLGSTFSSDASVTTAPTNALKNSVTECGLSGFNLGAFYKNPDISEGMTIIGYASFVCGPQLFWCQNAETEKLQRISDVIQKAGNALETEALNDESLLIGSGCIALYPEDKLWYRAKVTSREHDTLSVIFVDYGNESKVKMSEVRPLPCEVSDLPPQAFACQLDGFDISEGSWNDEADDQFFELVTDQLLKVTVLKLSSLLELETPHFVKLECGEQVINDAMKNCWNCKSASLEANALLVPSVDPSVVFEIRSSECVAEAIVRPKDFPPTAVDNPKDGVCISTVEIHHAEVECRSIMVEHQKQAALDTSDADMGIIPSEDEESGLKHIRELVVVEDLIAEKSQLTETFPGSENRGSNELDVEVDSHLNVLNDLVEISFRKDQLSDEKVEKPSTPEHEQSGIEDDPEIIKSDMGYLRRTAERNRIGSECVIWSHAHKNWCRAQILKISDDTTLVLLLDHDSEVVVDPVNIFEIVPAELLQVPCAVNTSIPKEEGKEMFEERNSAFDVSDPLSKAEEMKHKAVAGFASEEPSELNDEEMVEEPSAVVVRDMVIIPEEQPQDKNVSWPGYLVGDAEKILYEDEHKGSDEGPDIPLQMGETFEDGSAEQKEPVLEMDPVLALRQNIATDSEVQAQTEDAVEICPPVEEPRDKVTLDQSTSEVRKEEDELIDFLAVAPLEKVQNVELGAEPDLDALIEEVNSFTEDPIDFVSDPELDSDIASDDMLRGDKLDTELPAVTESSDFDAKASVSEHADSEELSVSRVSHLTLRVQDTSDDDDDDIIFVKAWQEPSTEASEPDSGE